ncbi:MAG: hypothetical protein CMM52_17120 [Rhodospirillaceae bacterium]|nr:hypothetical protein [Rhodospirillaceae bacterium]|tara:strand:+ start:2299 stop:2487 length:189 start_codon:yes stop_codon:yes gene_type:complete
MCVRIGVVIVAAHPDVAVYRSDYKNMKNLSDALNLLTLITAKESWRDIGITKFWKDAGCRRV